MSEEFGEFIGRLTDNARLSLRHAEAIARGQGSSYIGTEHMLLGVLAQGSSVGAKLLADVGVTLERVETVLPSSSGIQNGSPRSTIMTLSETAILTLKMAYEQTRELHQEFLGTEHILYNILKQKNARGTLLLNEVHPDIESIVGEFENYFDQQQTDYGQATTERRFAHKGRNSALATYGTDLTDLADRGKLDTVVGRDTETDRVITILSRRTKNNPLLIGEPGVGKTAIIEGLAQRIAHEDVPDHLLETRVIQLDLASMVAGTKYRGEFEERLKQTMKEIQSLDNTVVFIDELHVLVGAGAAEGSMDAANIIKPALARGELRLIGATTFDEYRKHIENDSALDRRFQTVTVEEPSHHDTVQILRGLKSHYEQYHGVVLRDELIKYAVKMADRYVFERYMPDKAIDVIDEAAAHARVHRRRPAKLRELEKERQNLGDAIEAAVDNQEYERAALYKTRLKAVDSAIDKAKKTQSAASVTLTDEHVARSVATMTNIPVEKVRRSERTLLRNLEKHLNRSIVGQQEAVEYVARSIRRSRSGIADTKRPIGSFIFMGPSGVGKTEMARVLAREVFGSEDALIKIDMSEFGERHNSSKLLGAPAGYVGYEDGGTLTEKVRRRPYSVVLFDEIEKAHRDIFHLLLQILEDGVVRDGRGRLVDFTNTIIILTSNVGAASMTHESKLGFQAVSRDQKAELEKIHDDNVAAAERELKRFIKPELLNRFDGVVTFRALTRKDVRRIFDHYVDELRDRLVSQGITLKVDAAAKRFLIDQGFAPHRGARPLRRVIENEIEHRIAEMIITGEFEKGDCIRISVKKGTVVLSVEHETS